MRSVRRVLAAAILLPAAFAVSPASAGTIGSTGPTYASVLAYKNDPAAGSVLAKCMFSTGVDAQHQPFGQYLADAVATPAAPNAVLLELTVQCTFYGQPSTVVLTAQDTASPVAAVTTQPWATVPTSICATTLAKWQGAPVVAVTTCGGPKYYGDLEVAVAHMELEHGLLDAAGGAPGFVGSCHPGADCPVGDFVAEATGAATGSGPRGSASVNVAGTQARARLTENVVACVGGDGAETCTP